MDGSSITGFEDIRLSCYEFLRISYTYCCDDRLGMSDVINGNRYLNMNDITPQVLGYQYLCICRLCTSQILSKTVKQFGFDSVTNIYVVYLVCVSFPIFVSNDKVRWQCEQLYLGCFMISQFVYII